MSGPKFKLCDVRPNLARGEEPFPLIRARVDALKPGEGVTIVAPFLPAPLIELLKSEGFASTMERRTDPADWDRLTPVPVLHDGQEPAGIPIGERTPRHPTCRGTTNGQRADRHNARHHPRRDHCCRPGAVAVPTGPARLDGLIVDTTVSVDPAGSVTGRVA